MVAQENAFNNLPQTDKEIIFDVLRSMTIQELEEFKRDLFSPNPA